MFPAKIVVSRTAWRAAFKCEVSRTVAFLVIAVWMLSARLLTRHCTFDGFDLVGWMRHERIVLLAGPAEEDAVQEERTTKAGALAFTRSLGESNSGVIRDK
jgi:hypothetical protein